MTEPVLVGRRVQLTPVATRHYDLIYDWAARGEIPWQWQWRGRPVSPEGLRESMWVDCLFHFVVESRDRARPIGLLGCYGANFHHQTCFLQAGLVERYRVYAQTTARPSSSSPAVRAPGSRSRATCGRTSTRTVGSWTA